MLLADAGILFTFGTRAWCVWIPSPAIRKVGWRGVVDAPRNKATVLWPASRIRVPRIVSKEFRPAIGVAIDVAEGLTTGGLNAVLTFP